MIEKTAGPSKRVPKWSDNPQLRQFKLLLKNEVSFRKCKNGLAVVDQIQLLWQQFEFKRLYSKQTVAAKFKYPP